MFITFFNFSLNLEAVRNVERMPDITKGREGKGVIIISYAPDISQHIFEATSPALYEQLHGFFFTDVHDQTTKYVDIRDKQEKLRTFEEASRSLWHVETKLKTMNLQLELAEKEEILEQIEKIGLDEFMKQQDKRRNMYHVHPSVLKPQ